MMLAGSVLSLSYVCHIVSQDQLAWRLCRRLHGIGVILLLFKCHNFLAEYLLSCTFSPVAPHSVCNSVFARVCDVSWQIHHSGYIQGSSLHRSCHNINERTSHSVPCRCNAHACYFSSLSISYCRTESQVSAMNGGTYWWTSDSEKPPALCHALNKRYKRPDLARECYIYSGRLHTLRHRSCGSLDIHLNALPHALQKHLQAYAHT